MQSLQENIIVDLILQHTKKIQIPEGLGGIGSIREFTLMISPAEAPLVWLLARNKHDIAFITVDPFLVCPEYVPEFADEDIEALKIQSAEDMLVLCITNIVKKPEKGLTVNLAAPLVINWVTGIGKQVILKNNQDYSIEHRLLPNTFQEAA